LYELWNKAQSGGLPEMWFQNETCWFLSSVNLDLVIVWSVFGYFFSSRSISVSLMGI